MREYSLKANFFVFGKRQKAPSFCSGIMIKVTSLYMYDNGNRSSRPRVISPEVMSPETWVMLPEILVMSPEKKSQARRNKYWKD